MHVMLAVGLEAAASCRDHAASVGLHRRPVGILNTLPYSKLLLSQAVDKLGKGKQQKSCQSAPVRCRAVTQRSLDHISEVRRLGSLSGAPPTPGISQCLK